MIHCKHLFDQGCASIVNKIFFLLGISLCLPILAFPLSTYAYPFDLPEEIIHDYKHYFECQNLYKPLIGLAISGGLANTTVDRHLQTIWQNDLQGEFGNHLAEGFTNVGDLTQYYYAVPGYIAAMALGGMLSNELSQWGNYCLRTLILGGPQQFFLTHFLGSGRPENGGSHWHLFQQQAAVSGHAFYGAIPLLALAHQSQNIYFKALWYGVSCLPGLARVYQNKHYSSQAFLGWWLAFTAMQAVSQTSPISPIHFSDKNFAWQLSLQDDTVFLGWAIKI